MPYFLEGSLTAWIPLTDVTPESGPLIYIKGSHLWKSPSSHAGAQLQDFEEQRLSIRQEKNREDWEELVADIPRGSVCFHHSKTLHGSASNNSQKERIALAVGLLTDTAVFDETKPDFGYANYLSNESICPIIYEKRK